MPATLKTTQPPAKRTRSTQAEASSEEFETASSGVSEDHAAEHSGEESASESDLDEAPEEETMSSGRNRTKELELQKQRLAAEAKRADREKRREQNTKFTQQQEEKKTRVEAQRQREVVPELLTEDFLASLQGEASESDDDEVEGIAGKHIQAHEFEEMEQAELKRQLKQHRAKVLRDSKKATIKKGPVRVTALSAKKMGAVPVSENRVTNARNKWLKRKGLGKR